MSAIYVTGDIHGDPISRFSSKPFPEGKDLTKDDYVIIVGDFGVLWKNDPDREENYLLNWLLKKPWTTLFLDGNHENFYRLNKLPVEKKFGGNVGVVRDGIYHLKRGELYNIYGNSIFCFGGALSWDKVYRKLGISYWEEEVPNNQEMDHGLSTLQNVDFKVDYILTHTLPRSLISVLGFSKDPNKEDATCKYLDHIADSSSFKKWYFGHMHVDQDMGAFKCLFHDIDILGGDNSVEYNR